MAVAATKSDSVIIRNGGDKAISLVVLGRFAYTSPDGKNTLIDDSNAPAYDAAGWITFGANKTSTASLNLGVGKTAVVNLTMTIPKGAVPGAHKAAIVVAATLGTGTVNVAKRVALIVNVQVPGTITSAAMPTWVKDSTFYEINIRNFTAARTFKGALNQVDDLKKLGVKAVVLDPIFALGSARMVGTLGSIFADRDLSDVNASLGDMTAFSNLAKALRAASIKVILTVPLKTAAIDHTWATDQPNWFVRDNTYNLVTDPATPYLANFDYTKPELKQAIYEALKPWVVTQDVDGFLFDGATSVPVAFVDELAYRLQALKPLLIGTTDQYSDAYQSSLYANSNDALRTLLETQDNGTLTNASFTSVINDMNANYSGSEFTFNAVSNYATMVGLQTETARMGPALPAAVALTFTLPGAPSIFQGQEVGSIKALKPYDADNVVWPTKDPAVLATYIKLVKLKKLNAALFSGSDGAEVSTLPTASTSLLAFKRTVGKNTVMVVVNLSKKALTTKFDAGAAATMFLFSNDKSVKLAAKANAVTLPAFGYEIYTPAVVK
jgi:glycosidase